MGCSGRAGHTWSSCDELTSAALPILPQLVVVSTTAEEAPISIVADMLTASPVVKTLVDICTHRHMVIHVHTQSQRPSTHHCLYTQTHGHTCTHTESASKHSSLSVHTDTWSYMYTLREPAYLRLSTHFCTTLQIDVPIVHPYSFLVLTAKAYTGSKVWLGTLTHATLQRERGH